MTCPGAGRGWLLAAALAVAPLAPAAAKGGPILSDRPGLAAPASLQVGSSAFPPGGAIPIPYSSYDRNTSPPLQWTAGPAATASFAVVIEDPDAAPATPIVHWIAWDIPASVTALPAGLDAQAPAALRPMRQGRNTHGGTGYYGPHPPANDPPHRYHVQVYALDRSLDLPAGSPLDDLAAAMAGHVLAHGELIGTFAWPGAQ